MNALLTYALLEFSSYQIAEDLMRKDFKRKADEAYKKYWDACKYPRKKKKKIRKKATTDYALYMNLSKPIFDF